MQVVDRPIVETTARARYGPDTSLTLLHWEIPDIQARLPTDTLDTPCQRVRRQWSHALESDGCDERANEICVGMGKAVG
jgi:hypothetical protein